MNIDVTFCDQVRNETNGKIFLIGVYPADVMMVSQIPGNVHVSAWVKVRDLQVGAYDFEMSFLSPQASLQSPTPYYANVFISHYGIPATMHSGPASIPLSEPGFVTLRLKITDALQNVVCDQVAGKIFIGKQT
ncbi:hypothetical protein [Pararhizobium sp. DWP1-1-3]|uniref:hypothetical protein n=1 Tax=Pararhizobium sp. DWP1-1-3 TaxID=2804652 RepID=UPI003CFAF1D5